MYVYLCHDTPESIFTAIYNIYEDKHNLPDTRILLDWEPVLFAEYIEVEEDGEKAEKVIRTIRRQFGEEDTHHLFMALAAPTPEKAEAVYRTIAYGLQHHVKPGHLFDHLADQSVLLANQLGRNAGREAQHLKGFLRFRELENGILFAVISPKNHILSELMEHFADRFPSEKFMILDEGRNVFGVHKAKNGWFLAIGTQAAEIAKNSPVSETEVFYAGLFRHFCQSIAIKERRNTDLQRNMLPLRFRPYMTEFTEQKNRLTDVSR